MKGGGGGGGGGVELVCISILHFLACHTNFWDNSSIINLETLPF